MTAMPTDVPGEPWYVTPGGRQIVDQPWGHRYWDGQLRDPVKTTVAPPSKA